ncbi:uncharacterized protein LOC114297280 [Camellia sinensis]|uniref:uncharacterized protein LOC114297280 n=1 Tax=Camellia sinensis TaxID=4442 RepID=UPI0010356DAA|nr:uncharacterized protein LOC114297280 [Camellia sinensis]
MNNLTKAILNGDFDESSSLDDDIIMMQLFTAQQQRIQILSLNQQTRRIGSISGRRYINCERIKGDEQIYRDYFADNPVNEYFIQTRDATSAPGLFGVQKMTAVLRTLQYGVPADAIDEYIRIDKSTAIAALNFFTRSIVATYEVVYLRSPNEVDVARLLQKGEQRGFPRMLQSLDYKSSLFVELTRGRAPAANYTINNHAYAMSFPTHRRSTPCRDTALINSWIITNTWTVIVFKRNAVIHRGIGG